MWGFNKADPITISPGSYDDRINWDTHLLMVGDVVSGMINKCIDLLIHKV